MLTRQKRVSLSTTLSKIKLDKERILEQDRVW